MKLAYIITCHKDAAQVERLINRLEYQNSTSFVIHASKTAEPGFYEELHGRMKGRTNVYFCKREDGTHNGFGIVKGVFNGLKLLFDKGVAFDYVNLISGQDYPIKSNKYIFDFFEANNGKQFLEYFTVLPTEKHPYHNDHFWGPTPQMYRVDRHYRVIGGVVRGIPEVANGRLVDHPLWPTIKIFLHESKQYLREGRFLTELQLLFFSRVLPRVRKAPAGVELYGGKTWWSVTRDAASYLLKEYQTNHALRNFYKHTFIPDEMYVHTMLNNSPFKDTCVNNCLRFIIWIPNFSMHPLILKGEHFEEIKASDGLYGRKFEQETDVSIMDRIDKEILFI